MKKDWNKDPLLLVGGEVFDVQQAADEDILKVIQNLPNGLQDRTRIKTDWHYNPTLPAAGYEFAAYNAYDNFKDTQNIQALKESVGLYVQAAQAYGDLGLDQPAGNMYSLAAQALFELPDNSFIDGRLASEHMIDYLDKAVALHDKQGHTDFSYRDRDIRYNAIAETALFYREHGASLPAHISLDEARKREAHYYEKLGPESEVLVDLSRKIQGKIEPDALRVEQKEIGISDSVPIGTDNLGPCIALMVYSMPQNSDGVPVVGVAHIDYETEVASIKELFDRMPEGQKDVRLLGARFDADPRSLGNLCDVVRELGKYDVNIISADVYQGDAGASSVVVYPQDFRIQEAVPMAGNAAKDASCACPLITPDIMHPLQVAFDTRQDGEARAPVFLDEHMVSKLNSLYLDKDYVQLYQAIKGDGLFDVGLSTRFIKDLADEYKKSLSQIHGYAQATLPEVAYDKLSALPIYIGENAEEKNRQLIDKIAGQSNSLENHLDNP